MLLAACPGNYPKVLLLIVNPIRDRGPLCSPGVSDLAKFRLASRDPFIVEVATKVELQGHCDGNEVSTFRIGRCQSWATYIEVAE